MQSFAVMQEYKDRHGIAKCYRYLGAIKSNLGQRAEGRDLYDKALSILREIGDEIGLGLVYSNLGETEFGEGHAQEALKAATDAMKWRRRLDKDAISTSSANKAAYQIALNDLAGARASAEEALRLARETQTTYTASIAVQHLATLAALRGRARDAAQVLGYVNAQYHGLGVARETTEQWCYDKTLVALREQLNDAELEKLFAEGANWSEDQTVEFALEISTNIQS